MLEFPFYAGEFARIEGHGKEHRVTGARPGDGQSDELRSLVLAMNFRRRRVSGRVSRIPQAVECRGDSRELRLLWVPYHAHHGVAKLQPCRGGTGDQLRQSLNKPHAGGTMNAFEPQVGR